MSRKTRFHQFTEKGGIEISVDRPIPERKNWLRFQVKDTGIGIAKESKGRLFKPFSQVDASIR
jgi:signal transduction histidine kinase